MNDKRDHERAIRWWLMLQAVKALLLVGGVLAIGHVIDVLRGIK